MTWTRFALTDGRVVEIDTSCIYMTVEGEPDSKSMMLYFTSGQKVQIPLSAKVMIDAAMTASEEEDEEVLEGAMLLGILPEGEA